MEECTPIQSLPCTSRVGQSTPVSATRVGHRSDTTTLANSPALYGLMDSACHVIKRSSQPRFAS